ncbi:MAG: hypothetical protein JXB35_02475 [Anaerolineae bacterium]|nr:hypothetical protein [Anaerolineae bacterium]
MTVKKDEIEVLRQAVLADVHETEAQLLEEARVKAAGILHIVQSETTANHEATLQKAQREVADLKQRILAGAELDAQSLKLKGREQLLEQVFAEAHEQLRAILIWPDYRDIVINLVREAAGHLKSERELVIRADEVTRKQLDDAVVAALSASLGIDMQQGAVLESGTGVVVETPTGHRRFDNRFETRLARLRDVLRADVYRILQESGNGTL